MIILQNQLKLYENQENLKNAISEAIEKLINIYINQLSMLTKNKLDINKIEEYLPNLESQLDINKYRDDL